MRTKLFKIVPLFAFTIVLGVFTHGHAANEPETPCKTFRQLLRPSAQKEMDQYQLFGTYSEGVERFNSLDIDGDGIADVVEKSCPGSNEPSDPCSLSIVLSSSAEAFLFEAWGFRLIKFRAEVYIIANADEMRKTMNIFRVDKTGFVPVCQEFKEG